MYIYLIIKIFLWVFGRLWIKSKIFFKDIAYWLFMEIPTYIWLFKKGERYVKFFKWSTSMEKKILQKNKSLTNEININQNSCTW